MNSNSLCQTNHYNISFLCGQLQLPDSKEEVPSPTGERSPTEEGSADSLDLGLGVNSIHSYVAGKEGKYIINNLSVMWLKS